jgi:hypothetical protein
MVDRGLWSVIFHPQSPINNLFPVTPLRKGGKGGDLNLWNRTGLHRPLRKGLSPFRIRSSFHEDEPLSICTSIVGFIFMD